MEINLKEYWERQKKIALEKFRNGAMYNEVKIYLIDKAIASNIDVGYTVREFYSNITKVTIEAYREFNGISLK